MSAQHTPGPWVADAGDMAQSADEIFTVAINAANGQLVGTVSAFSLLSDAENGVEYVTADSPCDAALQEAKANARLIAAAPEQHAEMLRYLPVLERAEAEPELWERLTAGLGIATLNGYRAAIAKAEAAQ